MALGQTFLKVILSTMEQDLSHAAPFKVQS